MALPLSGHKSSYGRNRRGKRPVHACHGLERGLGERLTVFVDEVNLEVVEEGLVETSPVSSLPRS